MNPVDIFPVLQGLHDKPATRRLHTRAHKRGMQHIPSIQLPSFSIQPSLLWVSSWFYLDHDGHCWSDSSLATLLANNASVWYLSVPNYSRLSDGMIPIGYILWKWFQSPGYGSSAPPPMGPPNSSGCSLSVPPSWGFFFLWTQESSLSSVCERVLDRCLAPSTATGEGCDNMTMILVQFKKPLNSNSGVAEPSPPPAQPDPAGIPQWAR